MVTTSFKDLIAGSLRDLALREYDWDGDGGLPLRSDTRETVERVFLAPQSFDTVEWRHLRPPEITLGADGTVEIVFVSKKSRREVAFTVPCRNVITYVRVLATDTTVDGIIRIDPDRPTDIGFYELRELLAAVA